MHEKGDETALILEGYTLLPTAYKILSNILVWILTVYLDEIIVDKCRFRRSR
jgi:hypothetical protein